MFCVFSGDSSLVDYHPDFLQWTSQVDDISTIYDVEEIPQTQGALFSPPPALLIMVEKMKASDLRQLLYRAEETGEDIAIVTQQKPRGNFAKDGITIIDLEYPQSVKKRTQLLQSVVPDVSSIHAQDVARHCDNFSDALLVSRQSTLLGDAPINWNKVFIPTPKDAPPWEITNAINDGYPDQAVAAVKKIVFSTRVTPQSLAMQLLGFYSKVAAGSTPYFAKIRRGVQDKNGLIEVLATYPEVVLRAGKSHHGIAAMVVALSAQFHCVRR